MAFSGHKPILSQGRCVWSSYLRDLIESRDAVLCMKMLYPYLTGALGGPEGLPSNNHWGCAVLYQQTLPHHLSGLVEVTAITQEQQWSEGILVCLHGLCKLNSSPYSLTPPLKPPPWPASALGKFCGGGRPANSKLLPWSEETEKILLVICSEFGEHLISGRYLGRISHGLYFKR